MIRAAGVKGSAVVMMLVAFALHAPAANAAENEPAITGSITGYYYAMRDQSDFGVGVASLNRDALHLEARYNYEARRSASIFAGWNFAGGENVTFQITPLVGALFGETHGVVPGVEASVAYRDVDAYVEAEYVYDLGHHDDSYFYAWSEIGWKPAQGLRVGLAGQRTRVVDTGRDLQRGAFIQFIVDKATLSVYGFNPDSGSRYVIVSFGLQF
jgi:hypothetical protein